MIKGSHPSGTDSGSGGAKRPHWDEMFVWALVGAAILVALGFFVQAASGEPFALGKYKIPSSLYRTDPHPRWVAVAWDAEEDAPFLPIRREVEEATADPQARDTTHKWSRKAWSAFVVWGRDCQSAVNLYRVSAYLAAAEMLDPSFTDDKDFHKMKGYVDMGWSVLREPPASYEFARRGYLSNAGDFDHHVFGDLPYRLLERDPLDRSAVIAMTREYQWRKPVEEFEQVMFAALERVSKTPAWRPWDDGNWARAHRSYGHKHQDASAYEVALAKARLAIAKTPPGWDPGWIREWIEDTRSEKGDPNFGRASGGRYIDDLDPP